jgi:hypothetical protein
MLLTVISEIGGTCSQSRNDSIFLTVNQMLFPPVVDSHCSATIAIDYSRSIFIIYYSE